MFRHGGQTKVVKPETSNYNPDAFDVGWRVSGN